MSGNLPFAAACDCHVHVVGTLDRFPQLATRSYTADVATLDALQEAGTPQGVSRLVIVQASFYGTDNSCLLNTLDALGDNGRGVAMLNPGEVSPGLLEEYRRRGVRGLRVNLYSKSLASAQRKIEDVLAATIENTPQTGWHVEVIASLPTLLSGAKQIAESAVPVVIDHYGLPGEFAPESHEGRALLDLAALPHVWVKLTAPYRVFPEPLATKPPVNWLKAFLQVAPERSVWGSDWPHTPLERDQQGASVRASYRPIRYGDLFAEFVRAVSDEQTAQRVLVINPARLYGFAPNSKREPS